MWRRQLNSKNLVITIYRGLEKVSDGTDTQVESQMNDKFRVKMIQRELYSRRNPSWKEDLEIKKENTVAIWTILVTIVIQYILEQSSSKWAVDKLSCTNLVHFCLIVLETHYNCYPIHLSLVFLPTLYKFIVLGSLGQWSQTESTQISSCAIIFPLYIIFFLSFSFYKFKNFMFSM